MAGKPDEHGIEPIELVTNEPESHSELEVSTSPSSRRWLLLGAAVLGALVVAAMVTGSDAPDSADPEPTTTSSPVTSPAPVTVPPTLDPETIADGPLLGRPHDASVLIGDSQRWRLVDLSTGIVRSVPALDGVAPDALLPVRGHVVIHERSFGRPTLIPFPVGDEDDVRAITHSAATSLLPEIGGERLDDVVGVLSGDPDQVWVLHPPQDGPPSSRLQATKVDLLGNHVEGPIEVPGVPTAATADGLVVDVAGRSYLTTARAVTELGVGVTLDARGDLVARVVCDVEVVCNEEIHDVGAATRPGIRVPTDVTAERRVTMVLSDQGGLATIPGLGPRIVDSQFAPAVPLHVTPPGGDTVTVQLPSVVDAPVWLPDGNGLVVLSRGGLQHVSIESGLLAMRRIDGFDVGDATALFVIPH